MGMYNVGDKERNLTQYNNYTLNKTLSMFEWSGLPETIPYRELEKILQTHGTAFITEVEGELYAFSGALGGLQDVYGNPTQITITNVGLNFNATLDINKDGILFRNDDLQMGILPLINKYNSALVENDITLYLAGINNRMQTLISASDDKTKASAEVYIEKLIKGEVSIIGEAALFDGVKRQDANSNQGSSFTSLIEFHQYIKGGLYNELGLNSNFNMKRERLTEGEVESVEDTLFPFVDNMMKCRLKAVELINAKYSTEINVDYGSIWNKKNREMVDDIIKLENDGGELSTDKLKNSQRTSRSNGQLESLELSIENLLSEQEGGPVNDSEEPIEDELVDGGLVEDEPVEDDLVDDEPAEDEPVDDDPAEDKPVEDEPVDGELVDGELLNVKLTDEEMEILDTLLEDLKRSG